MGFRVGFWCQAGRDKNKGRGMGPGAALGFTPTSPDCTAESVENVETRAEETYDTLPIGATV